MSSIPEATNLAILLSTLLPLLLLVVVNIVMGVIALNLAKSRGFNTVAAFFTGLVGGLAAVLIILMFPKKQDF
jgi:hypothetical protein